MALVVGIVITVTVTGAFFSLVTRIGMTVGKLVQLVYVRGLRFIQVLFVLQLLWGNVLE